MIDSIWPYVTLAGASFLAATLLPFSSEVALIANLKAGLGTPERLVAAATFGNVAGACFNWWIGRSLRRFEGRRWFPFAPDAIERASQRFRRYGVGVLLLSWLPIVGDPLTLVAGVLRVPLSIFLPLVAVGKAARYVVIAAWA